MEKNNQQTEGPEADLIVRLPAQAVIVPAVAQQWSQSGFRVQFEIAQDTTVFFVTAQGLAKSEFKSAGENGNDKNESKVSPLLPPGLDVAPTPLQAPPPGLKWAPPPLNPPPSLRITPLNFGAADTAKPTLGEDAAAKPAGEGASKVKPPPGLYDTEKWGAFEAHIPVEQRTETGDHIKRSGSPIYSLNRSLSSCSSMSSALNSGDVDDSSSLAAEAAIAALKITDDTPSATTTDDGGSLVSAAKSKFNPAAEPWDPTVTAASDAAVPSGVKKSGGARKHEHTRFAPNKKHAHSALRKGVTVYESDSATDITQYSATNDNNAAAFGHGGGGDHVSNTSAAADGNRHNNNQHQQHVVAGAGGGPPPGLDAAPAFQWQQQPQGSMMPPPPPVLPQIPRAMAFMPAPSQFPMPGRSNGAASAPPPGGQQQHATMFYPPQPVAMFPGHPSGGGGAGGMMMQHSLSADSVTAGGGFGGFAPFGHGNGGGNNNQHQQAAAPGNMFGGAAPMHHMPNFSPPTFGGWFGPAANNANHVNNHVNNNGAIGSAIPQHPDAAFQAPGNHQQGGGGHHGMTPSPLSTGYSFKPHQRVGTPGGGGRRVGFASPLRHQYGGGGEYRRPTSGRGARFHGEKDDGYDSGGESMSVSSN